MTAVQHPAALREYSDVEYVFEAHSTKRPAVREYVSDLWARRQFLKTLAAARLRGERSNTFMGELWGVLDPLFQAAIYIFVVAVIRGGRAGPDAWATATMIIAGVFFFNYTRAALNEGGRSILNSKGLMLNSSFPRALLPLAEIYKGLLEFLPSIVLYAIIHLAAQRPVGQGIFLLPLLFLLQTAMGIGMAFLVATATVYVRDTVNLLNYVTRILIFITPVIYPASSLTPALRAILSVNPLFPLFSAYQTIVLGGVPSVGQVLLTTFWAVVFLVVGYRVFVSHERAFALRL
jgi:teichoic acid transport system permease protein